MEFKICRVRIKLNWVYSETQKSFQKTQKSYPNHIPNTGGKALIGYILYIYPGFLALFWGPLGLLPVILNLTIFSSEKFSSSYAKYLIFTPNLDENWQSFELGGKKLWFRPKLWYELGYKYLKKICISPFKSLRFQNWLKGSCNLANWQNKNINLRSVSCSIPFFGGWYILLS